MTSVVTWITLNIFDLYLTSVAISNGASEWNASINWFNVDDTHEFIIWKVAFVFTSLVFLWFLGERGFLNPRKVLTLCSLVMIGICVWNLIVVDSVTTGGLFSF